MNAKQRFDEKRREDPGRKFRERERAIIRKMVRKGEIKKLGSCNNFHCENFWKKVKTVWHHVTYAGEQSALEELCYVCHRAKHPRSYARKTTELSGNSQ